MPEQLLRDANYKIAACCVLCRYGNFGNSSMRGRCTAISSEANQWSMAVSTEIVRYGVCDLYEVSVSEKLSQQMGEFMEFCE